MSAAGPAPPFRSRSCLHLAAPTRSRPGAFPVCGSRQPAPRSPAPFPCRLAARRWSVPGGSVRSAPGRRHSGSFRRRSRPARPPGARSRTATCLGSHSAACRSFHVSAFRWGAPFLLEQTYRYVVAVLSRRGRSSVVQRLVIRGRSCTLGLGNYGLVSLPEGRELARANRKIARSGRDRLADRGRATGVPPFEEAVEKVVGIDSEACAHPDRTQRQWRRWLYDHACARIGDAVSRNPSAGPTVRSATASCLDSLLSSGRQVPHGGRVLAETPEALGRIHPQRRPPARRRRQLRRPRPFRPLLPRASPRGCVSVSGPPLGRRLGNGCADRCRRAAWTRRLRLRVVDRPVANGTAPRYTRYVAGFSC